MLSSLLEQDAAECLMVDVACMPGNGRPSTEQVAEIFQATGLSVRLRMYEDYDHFQRRGLVRNDQLADCPTDWIWFADSDHVYHRQFVGRLLDELSTHQHGRLITAGRISLPQEDVGRLVDASLVQGLKPIPSPFEQTRRLQPHRRMSAVGAGHTQIVHARQGLHRGVYVPAEACRDNRWSETYQKARSDVQFRRRCGGRVKLPDWFTFNQLHLNHPRDNEAGKHLEIQR